MKKATFAQMIDKTSLIPSLAAETVLDRANLNLEMYKDFIQSCNTRTLDHYNHNEYFRKNLQDGKSSRYFLAGFIRHWLKAYDKNPNQYLIDIGYAVAVIECGSCDHIHRVDYYGDCRNNDERFADLEDAEKKLGKKVIEVFL